MSNEIKDGGQAFPLAHDVPPTEPDSVRAIQVHSGMSLRDYFAAKALPVCIEFGELAVKSSGKRVPASEFRRAVTSDSYAWADAMLAAREGKA